MSYRQYFAKIKRKEIEKIRHLNEEEIINWCKDNDLYEDEYIILDELLEKINATVIFNFGDSCSNEKEIISSGEELFTNNDTKKLFKDNNPYIVSKEAVENTIECFRKKIISNFEDLLLDDEDYRRKYPWSFNMDTKQERMEKAIKEKIQEWTYVPYNLNSNSKGMITSCFYEYEIFELVSLYRNTNWEEECLVFYGW